MTLTPSTNLKYKGTQANPSNVATLHLLPADANRAQRDRVLALARIHQRAISMKCSRSCWSEARNDGVHRIGDVPPSWHPSSEGSRVLGDVQNGWSVFNHLVHDGRCPVRGSKVSSKSSWLQPINLLTHIVAERRDGKRRFTTSCSPCHLD